jgi:hypothetical protein
MQNSFGEFQDDRFYEKAFQQLFVILTKDVAVLRYEKKEIEGSLHNIKSHGAYPRLISYLR